MLAAVSTGLFFVCSQEPSSSCLENSPINQHPQILLLPSTNPSASLSIQHPMPITHLPFLASISQAVAQTSSSSNAISFQTALLVIIAGALLFLAKNLASLNRRLASLEAAKTQAPLPTPKPVAPTASLQLSPASPSDTVAPQIVAAISAAIHTTLRARHRIISVGEICPNRQAWSAEGRRQVFSSHKVR